MKKIMFSFVFCMLMFCFTAASYASLSQFAGYWKNGNSSTRGITKIKILVRGTRVTVQAWGKCHPRDCYWGTVRAYRSPRANLLTATFKSSFSNKSLVIKPYGRNRLQVNLYNRFTDNSRRKNYRSSYILNRSYSNSNRPRPRPSMPGQISPANGTRFHHYPRRTTLRWTPVPGAISYCVEYQYKSGYKWSRSRRVFGIKGTTYTFNFVGAQPGRWRVWAVKTNRRVTPKTAWWGFSYSR